MPRLEAHCTNCGARCVTRDVLPSCNRCLPIVRQKRERYKKGGWPTCLVTIARIERWVAYDQLTA
ncbi:hypothetical protein BARRETLEMON_59 [Arthrobacter phage BarretLemon]|uniref:Uncharacterized protein n=4 Tax=Marthavirus barretlemon TaxID=2560300 RepID=A0A386KMN6_9CAUD|nr:hypothetical protein BJD79_gp59 [Arthrobacter phage BarretLemon]AMM44521.1 hypothetical protein BARRETLEMON_59 [Arthrobacter phage BarretLemon]ASR78088.1 hypothetical protein SEA_TIMINATOR_59 [Arthrobacter phage Timinator]AYD86530.1 hypothetical protein SEA_LEEROYJ_59 [Arthrobacter phage LeeroyJ]QJD53389.1 hypothetical protein SEA_STEVIEBAY_59 [Arthrobacter phage StevieBAY]